MPDADKHTIETERGYKRSDYAAHFAAIKGLTFDGTLFSANDAADKLSHDTHKFNLQYADQQAHRPLLYGRQRHRDCRTGSATASNTAC